MTPSQSAQAMSDELVQRCKELEELATMGQSEQKALNRLANTYLPSISPHDRKAMAQGQTNREARRFVIAAASAQSTVQAVAWRARGYGQFRTGKPGEWRYIDGAGKPTVNDPANCDIEPLYAAPPKDDSDHLSTLLCEIRAACGDNGERERDELVGFIGEVRRDAERYRAFFDSGLPITFCGVDYYDKASLDAAIDATPSQRPAQEG
ncbi:hypothetical protein HDG34_005858 [Paraburkholderia sp. HC6.4b]|uniref:hypothetical protein n=1 Tax=unclassified Paraburkholderia TaxID=2615204 RepID=UPI0016170FD5|nr:MULTISPECIES: hypothetical protein [unclassified Paraburkholderia]MBB5411892.1 hypothetical protein [Paraburkholderia sp. HC6.4b]MBB5450204.1 hypothetical protein [Paraburkholderia sp. Kb1A]